jgi:hypothetical protein
LFGQGQAINVVSVIHEDMITAILVQNQDNVIFQSSGGKNRQ